MRIITVSVPTGERQGLGLAKTERQVDLVDRDRDIYAPLLRARCLVLDERSLWAHRPLAPHDDDAFGGVQLCFDFVAPGGAAADLLIPPDAVALGLQRLDQRPNPLPVLGFVGDENVRHRAPLAHPLT